MAPTFKDPEEVPVLHREESDEESDEDDISGSSDFDKHSTRRAPQPVLSVDPTAVYLVYVINFLDALGGSISTPILPFYAAEFDASYTQVGQLFSAFAVAQMASMPMLSWASDRFGRRSVLLFATFGTALGALWQATAGSYNSLLASRIFSGAWSGVASVCQVYLVDVVPPVLRAEYVSYLNSSTQASVLFGPSIGAGLSALGLQAPLCVQSFVSFLVCVIVYCHLPESPEWCRLSSPASPVPSKEGAIRRPRTRPSGMGRRNMIHVIFAYGILSFCGMVSQMAILSMFAIYATKTYENITSVMVGFIMTLGAMSSVGTNIWISPHALKRFGEFWSSIVGFFLVALGAGIIALSNFWITLLGFILAYQGLAINSSAVATGAANMTDTYTRASIMTGTRMLKSLGAVVGPMMAGHLASTDVRLPFVVAALLGILGGVAQVLTRPVLIRIKETLRKRRVVGMDSALLEGQWIDEHGTPEEIWDLGQYVADLLTQRHYRWVTYNRELKNFLSDSFPELPKGSEAAHKRAYDARRRIVREQSKLKVEAATMSYQELLQAYQALQRENLDLKDNLIREKGPPRKLSMKTEERNFRQKEFETAMSGFGANY